MTPRNVSARVCGIRSERGVGLIIVLLMMAVVSALVMTLTVSGRTHVMISRNHEMHAHARSAAEAGLNHGLELTMAHVRQWKSNGFASMSDAMSSLLRGPDNAAGTAATDADNGSLETFGIPRAPGTLDLDATARSSYEVRVFDEDDPARGATLSADDMARISENSSPTADGNARIIVRAIGYAPSSTQVALEAVVSPAFLPAIVTNDSLEISGNPTIGGTQGSVHSNTNLTISGNPTISQNATASATYTQSGTPNVSGETGGGRQNMSIPPIRAIDYKPLADFVLKNDGTMTNLGGASICPPANCKTTYGWEFNGTTGWKLGNNAANGTYYVEGRATISGNPGTAENPVSISIIAEGSIEISGNPDLRPDAPEVLFVTDGDLKLAGSLDLPSNVEGQILVHEQLHIGGTPTLFGQILVENAPNVSTLVTQNLIAGNPSITYNGLVGANTVNVSGWREVR